MDETLIFNELIKINTQLGGIQQTLVAQGAAFTVHCAADDKDRDRLGVLEKERERHTGAKTALGWAVSFLISLAGAAAGWFGAKHM